MENQKIIKQNFIQELMALLSKYNASLEVDNNDLMFILLPDGEGSEYQEFNLGDGISN